MTLKWLHYWEVIRKWESFAAAGKTRNNNSGERDTEIPGKQNFRFQICWIWLKNLKSSAGGAIWHWRLPELLEATSTSRNGMLAVMIYVFGWDTQLFFEARKKFALNLKPSTDTLLQKSVCFGNVTLFIWNIKKFIILRFYSYKTRAGGAIIKTRQEISGQRLVPQRYENTKQSGLVTAMHVWGECQCLLDQAVTAHAALFLSDIFYVLVLFLLYFLLPTKQFLSALLYVIFSKRKAALSRGALWKHHPDEERAGTPLAFHVPP